MDEEIRRKILTLLDQHRIMTIAALRPDGWPQATTVGCANEGGSDRFPNELETAKSKCQRVSRVDVVRVEHIRTVVAANQLSTASGGFAFNRCFRCRHSEVIEHNSSADPLTS